MFLCLLNLNIEAIFNHSVSSARRCEHFLTFTEEFCRLAVNCPYDNENLKSLFWIGEHYHHPVDLPETTRQNWKESIIWCLERTAPAPEPDLSPSTAERSCEPPADVEGPTAAMSEPDQGCEPTTPVAEGTETEDWLIDFSAELLSAPSSTITQSSDSPPAPLLPDVYSPSPSLQWRWAASRATTSSANLIGSIGSLSGLCSLRFSARRPVSFAWLLPSSAPPETLGRIAPPGSLVPPAPLWSVITLLPLRTYGPSSALLRSVPPPLPLSSVLGRTPDAISHHNTILALPSLDTAVGCLHWRALGLCHQAVSIFAAGTSSSFGGCHSSVAANPHQPSVAYCFHLFTTSLSSSKATSLVIVITIGGILSQLCSV